VDVVYLGEQRLAGLDHQRLETPLEQVPGFLAVAIEPVRKRRLQPAHAFGQVSPGRAQAQVKMIRDDAVGQQLPAGALAGLNNVRSNATFAPSVSKMNER